MQPEPYANSSRVATENTTEQSPSPASQHGLPLHDHRPAVALSSEDDAGVDSTTEPSDQLALDASLAASLQEAADGAQSRGDRRLSARNTPSPPARNRIAEYEQASTPPVRKRQVPEFEVIKKQRSPSDKRAPVQELPNG